MTWIQHTMSSYKIKVPLFSYEEEEASYCCCFLLILRCVL